MKWFRFYHEFVDDPKIAMMSDSDQLLWVKALCLASDSNSRGFILLSDEEICWKLRVTLEVWKHAIDKFRAKGMIEHCKQGYRIINWDKRQYESDTSATRTRKYREKLKASGKKRASDNPVTSQQQAGDNFVTSPDTDTESDTDQNRSNLSISSNYIHTGDRQADAPCGSVEPIEVEAVLVESDPIDSMSFDLAQSEPSEPKHQDIPFSTVEQPELFATQTVSVEDKSSGATKKSSRKKKEAKVDNPSFWDELRDRYNANKPEFWAKCDSFGPERRRSVTALRKCYGDEELLLRIEQALSWATTSSYWAAEQADFSCLLVKSHIERWSEAWRNRGNGKPRSQGDLKMMNLYKTVSSYFD